MYLAFDCETGGLNPQTTSLLTVYFTVLNDKFEFVTGLPLAVKHPIYHVEPKAMQVNGINLVEHDRTAYTKEFCIEELEFLLGCCPGAVPVGHNVDFDIGFVEQLLPDFRKKISHRKLDTAVIGRFLKLTGKIPNTVEGLGDYLTHFDIPVVGLHNAQNDTEATVELLKAMIKLGAE